MLSCPHMGPLILKNRMYYNLGTFRMATDDQKQGLKKQKKHTSNLGAKFQGKNAQCVSGVLGQRINIQMLWTPTCWIRKLTVFTKTFLHFLLLWKRKTAFFGISVLYHRLSTINPPMVVAPFLFYLIQTRDVKNANRFWVELKATEQTKTNQVLGCDFGCSVQPSNYTL